MARFFLIQDDVFGTRSINLDQVAYAVPHVVRDRGEVVGRGVKLAFSGRRAIFVHDDVRGYRELLLALKLHGMVEDHDDARYEAEMMAFTEETR